MNHSAQSADRQIRVFISSTFRDMEAERDYLVKFIFPQLRKLCESRGVTWGEVDLRWGVTDEQVAEGKVLPICLEEIKRCRPYFIGLLGERYGWIPEAIPGEVIEREPWLKEHLHSRKSVTELEIIHGVLRDEQMHGHAYFYFRDQAFIETIPPEQRQNFITENAESAEKLRRLKDLIRHAQTEQVCQLRENYSDPKALGDLVLADLTKVIKNNWPEGSQLDPLDREAMEHEAYAKSRQRVYIGRQEYFDRLNTHAAAKDTQPLVILGESGSGKSALLANWTGRYRQAHPDALVLQHYIGATPYSADWAAMLRRLMGELKRQLGIRQDIPDQPDALRSAFPNWLYMAAAKGRVVLVLDALNQLEDRDGARDLVWLPPVLPEDVRLIVSTLPGRPLDEIQKLNCPTLKVEPLDERERTKLLWRFLSKSGKRLSRERRRRIAYAPQSANPLYLRVLLDELRLVRTHEELEERIRDYLKADSADALYEKVIARWALDYEGDSDLVGDTLSLLWAARRGLTETELLQALGKDGEPLPCAKWSPLFLAMSDALISRGGLLTFAHDFLRTAVKMAYLPTEQNQQQAHLRIADYFQVRPADRRRTEELPWQLKEGRSWQRLFDLVTNIAFFTAMWDEKPHEMQALWSMLENQSSFRMTEGYERFIERATSDTGTLLRLSRLFRNNDLLSYSRRCLNEILVAHFDRHNELDEETLANIYQDMANVELESGNVDAARRWVNRCLRRATGNPVGVASLQTAALIAKRNQDWKAAIQINRQALSIAETCLDDYVVSGLLINIGNLARRLGDFHQARESLDRAEFLARTLGSPEHEARAKYGLANVALDEQKHTEARARYAAGLHKYDEMGDRTGSAMCYMALGTLSRQLGDSVAAITNYQKAIGILSKENQSTRTAESLSVCYENLAFTFAEQGNEAESRNNLWDAYCLRNRHGLSIPDYMQTIFSSDSDMARRWTAATQLANLLDASK